MTFVVGGRSGGDHLEQRVVIEDGRWLSDRVAMIDLSGMIYNGNKPGLLGSGDNPVSLIHEKLQKAKRDERVKAVILRLNSPGGTVTASDLVYRMVEDFKRESGKPVIALMMDVAASGAYYVACSADRIVAHPTTVTASIGVLLQTVSLKPALGRIGVEAEAITSGPNKDAGSLLGRMTDENRAVLRALVDDFYGRFVGLVRSSRPKIPAEVFAQATDGRVVSGTQALAWGLVDELGDLPDAFAIAKKMAGVDEADLVMYRWSTQYVGSPYAAAPGPLGSAAAGVETQVNLVQLNFPGAWAPTTPGFYYLWQAE